MRVLVACEFSGTVRDAFRARGHDAVSCDLLPSESGGPHIQDDVLDHLDDGWDLMVAHPPCTYLCNSGVRWLRERTGRWELMRQAAELFRTLMECQSIPIRAIENPVMHGHAASIIGRYCDQVIQPWQFGHGEQKATCLWLNGLPLLKPTNIVDGREQRLHKLPPSEGRWKLRSTTYQGIADAMAEQWGIPVSEQFSLLASEAVV